VRRGIRHVIAETSEAASPAKETASKTHGLVRHDSE
jgi:hypothetical protein